MKLVMGLVEIGRNYISTRIMWGHENYVLYALYVCVCVCVCVCVVAADCLSNAELNTALVWVL